MPHTGKWRLLVPTLLFAAVASAHAEQAPTKPIAVTLDSFIRAETDRFFGLTVQRGGFAQFAHLRQLMPVDVATVVRPNRDTLYSTAVFDLDAGPVTVTMPDSGDRYMSLAVIDEDQQVLGVDYGAGRHTFSRQSVGTRYVMLGVRTLVDPASTEDLKQVHALQDAITLSQPDGPGRFEPPSWDKASQDALRQALLVLGRTVPDSRGMFGKRDVVDPVRHLVGSAIAWGGLPEKDALYDIVTPAHNDGSAVYRLSVKDVPVDGFWSVSVYDAEGNYRKNPAEAYTLNNLTAQKSADGSIAIQFGGCEAATSNCLPVMPGWNYMVRLYRPRAQVLDGSWTFPAAQPVR
ncbi:DUF1254 domain-containing protein [Pseudomonas sp. L-22-4S-12]|uniref:DUF1254 domain-containing protein n=1 Tax=Pseudomonas sp. L-22-4S-12 TaxID=2610893 RepID=UPI0013247D07|nr:DUF1254 domain-containing protein [Pseudomonas sp. L-22-4S-12]MWV17030.1 DUF1254 domain-containing protein [Pseudomonas sp. L-22-4S-12]